MFNQVNGLQSPARMAATEQLIHVTQDHQTMTTPVPTGRAVLSYIKQLRHNPDHRCHSAPLPNCTSPKALTRDPAIFTWTPETFNFEGDDRVTWLRLLRQKFVFLTVGLALRRELHSWTKRIQIDINEGHMHAPDAWVFHDNNADMDLQGPLYTDPYFFTVWDKNVRFPLPVDMDLSKMEKKLVIAMRELIQQGG